MKSYNELVQGVVKQNSDFSVFGLCQSIGHESQSIDAGKFLKNLNFVSPLLASFHHNSSWQNLTYFHQQFSDFSCNHCHVIIEGMHLCYKYSLHFHFKFTSFKSIYNPWYFRFYKVILNEYEYLYWTIF